MPIPTFDFILNKIRPLIQKEDAYLRQSIDSDMEKWANYGTLKLKHFIHSRNKVQEFRIHALYAFTITFK